MKHVNQEINIDSGLCLRAWEEPGLTTALWHLLTRCLAGYSHKYLFITTDHAVDILLSGIEIDFHSEFCLLFAV